MNSIIKFNKHVLDFQSITIREFVDDLKLVLPEDIHSIIDQHLKKYTEQMKVPIKNTKNKIKKPSKNTAWKLFATHKSKDFPNLTQAEKWSACSPFWAELKKSGEYMYWQDLADKLNNEQSPEDGHEQSESEPEPEPEEPVKKPKATKKAEPAAKKDEPVSKKAEPATKKDEPATKKKPVSKKRSDDDTLAPEQYVQINMDE